MGAIMGAVPAGIKGLRQKKIDSVASQARKAQIDREFFNTDDARDAINGNGRDIYGDEKFDAYVEYENEKAKEQANSKELSIKGLYGTLVCDPNLAGTTVANPTRGLMGAALRESKMAFIDKNNPNELTELGKSFFNYLGYENDEQAMKDTLNAA